MRLTSRMAVVLPHPDGPTSTQISPAGTLKLRSRSPVVLHRGSAWRHATNSTSRRLRPSGCRTAPRLGRCVRWTREEVPGADRRGRMPTGQEPDRPPGGPPRAPRPRARRRAARAARRAASAAGDEPVGEPGVLRQQRAVQVGADRRRRARRPRSPTRRCCRGRAGPCPAAARRRRGACGRRGSRSPASTAGVAPASSTSIATLPMRRGPVHADGAQVDEPDARGPPRRRTRRRGRGAGSRRRPRGRACRRRPRRAARRAWSRRGPARTATGRGPGRRRGRRGRARPGRSASPRPAAVTSKPIPRHSQRRSSSSRLPRSA